MNELVSFRTHLKVTRLVSRGLEPLLEALAGCACLLQFK